MHAKAAVCRRPIDTTAVVGLDICGALYLGGIWSCKCIALAAALLAHLQELNLRLLDRVDC